MVLKYPFPYNAWFTIANDPDNTNIKDWRELDKFIWQELGLPISNSLFVRSYNANLPDQVNLFQHPEITSQWHDIIHTWGDYMHSRGKGFDREDAEEAIKILKAHGVSPKVWIDHADFIGNLLHNSQKGALPYTKDLSGHQYKIYTYTLDLIKQIGIHYIWDGELTEIVGQDRAVNSWKYFSDISTSRLKAVVKFILLRLLPEKFVLLLKMKIPQNRQYFVEKFPDGNSFYCFRRYGTWKDADIYGLGNIIDSKVIDQLIDQNGTMVTYTHLGKRPFDRLQESFHIPDKTREALTYIRKKFDEQQLMVSPISQMLDYLVIRDHIKIDESKSTVHFYPDGIRYEKLELEDLGDHVFSFRSSKVNANALKVFLGQKEVPFHLVKHKSDIFSIRFE
ncbi:MAG: hypothetical protein R8G66_16825 [Cytophagales bacterium]|nr:hypothetical protein [Cytophagales bacterium]